MPLAAANFSHFVGGFGFGRGFDLGSWIAGGGNKASGPSEEGWVGSWNNADNRACTPLLVPSRMYFSASALNREI